ncbi:unnamed protein product [marine sediment metagenome]|uniref:Uncharacterized protein n=1 Tax=marine sediment metagenome TaxID=412755 RepID=X0RLY0_9ZZZZ
MVFFFLKISKQKHEKNEWKSNITGVKKEKQKNLYQFSVPDG